MKRSVLLKLGFLCGMAAGSAANGQVFNVHDIQHGYFFYGGYNVMAFGQGAASDPGNNIWNGFGNAARPGSTASFGGNHPNDLLLPGNPGNPYAWSSAPYFAQGTSLFSPANFSAAGAGNATSAGKLSSVTIPVLTFGANSGSTTPLDPAGTYSAGQPATARTNVALMLYSEAAVVNGSSPGAGTAGNPQGLMILSNVPAGTYDVYLYGANFDGTRGASFVVDSGTPTNGIYQTINPFAASGNGPETNFVLGVDYTVYNNVTPDADSTIHITWGAISNNISGLAGEGDLNGLQLVPGKSVQAGPTVVSPPINTIFAQGSTATLPADARGNPAVAFQWYGGNSPGTPIAGQTNRTLSLTAAQASQSGNYFLVATNIYGSATSSVATLTIESAPAIVAQSTTTSTNAVLLYSGHNHFGFSVTAYGDATQPLYFYWQNNGVTTAVTTNSGTGETNTFAWVNVTASGAYSCLLSNSFGTVRTSALAVTTVTTPASSYASALLGLNPYAYWPLNETSTTFAYDYVGGNNGFPINNGGSYAVAQPGPITGFGASSLAYTFSGEAAVDVPGAKLNLTGPMTLITWAQGGSDGFETPIGKGDKAYRIDIDGNGVAHFNDNGGSDAQGGPDLEDGNWHQLVGTFTGTNIYLYVDGALVSSQGDTSKTGDSLDLYIGSDSQYFGSRDFLGSLAQVAILTNALTAAQVLSLYQAGETPPIISIQPTNINGFVGGSATFAVSAEGGVPLTYQWTGPAGVIAGATNSTLVVSNLTLDTPANNGAGTYYVTITNPYGSTNTASDGSVQLTVSASNPFFVQDLPQVVYGIIGAPLTLSVVEGGSVPITNRWFYGTSSTPTTALQNGGRIGGANSATLTITNAQLSDAGYYQVWATNGVSPYYSGSQVAQVIMESEPVFNTNGAGWTVNGTVANVAANLLTLTDGNGGEYDSIFFDTPVYVGAFTADFTYTATNNPSVDSTTSLADGATFCIQNSPEGAAAIGGGGGSLGYAGITESAALAIDLYNANPGGIQFVSGGANPNNGIYTLSSPVVLTTGHPVHFTVHYDGEALAVKMVDTIATTNVFTTNFVVGPISQYVGSDTALIGFTGATGGVSSLQTISNFSYIPEPVLTASRSGNGIVISWPAGVGGYALQAASSLTYPSWTTVSGAPTADGTNLQVTVPAASGSQFFRLVIQ